MALELKSTISLRTFALAMQEVIKSKDIALLSPEKRKAAVIEAYYRIMLASTDDEGRAKALSLLYAKRQEAKARGYSGPSLIPGTHIIAP